MKGKGWMADREVFKFWNIPEICLVHIFHFYSTKVYIPPGGTIHVCREKLSNNDNDNAEVRREEAVQGERWKDIIDRVASRTLGGHTDTSYCNRLHTSYTQAVHSWHLLHIHYTQATHSLHIKHCAVPSYQLALPCSLPLNIYTAIVTGDGQRLFGEKLQCVSRYIGGAFCLLLA